MAHGVYRFVIENGHIPSKDVWNDPSMSKRAWSKPTILFREKGKTTTALLYHACITGIIWRNRNGHRKISKYLLTTVLKLLKGVPDLWRADVSRIIKELKEMAELESHAGERQRSVIRAHREFLIDEAAERLAYETYTRKGLRFWANQQELVCGYFSLFLVGGLYGIDVGLLLLVCAMSQDMNGAAAVGKLLIAFAVTASSTILAAMIGKRIYTRGVEETVPPRHLGTNS